MLLSGQSFRISENLHRTWQRNPEVRNMKSKNKTKKGLWSKYRPGIIDKEGSHPRPSVLLWLNAADDERGHIFRNLSRKWTLESIFKKWASDLPDPMVIVNHFQKKKKGYVTWFWGPSTPHVRLLCVLFWAALPLTSLLCKERAWQVYFSNILLGWHLSKVYVNVDIDNIDVKGHLGVFSHVGLVVDRHVSASVFAQVSSLCGAPSEKKAYCEF